MKYFVAYVKRTIIRLIAITFAGTAVLAVADYGLARRQLCQSGLLRHAQQPVGRVAENAGGTGAGLYSRRPDIAIGHDCTYTDRSRTVSAN